jgi:hypothetical protein
MAEPPKKSDTCIYRNDSANFPTFKVNVQAPIKNAATSPPKDQPKATAEKPQGA